MREFGDLDMTKHTSIALDDDLSAFVEGQVGQGHYQSASDVVAAALRLLEEHEQKVERLRAALIEGEESGIAEEFDFDAFLAGKNAS